MEESKTHTEIKTGIKTESAAQRRAKREKKKKIIWFTVLICVIAFLVYYFIPKKKKTVELPPIAVQKEIAKNQIQISGYIEAAQEQKFQSPGEGIVEKVNVKEGDTVKKGQLLFALDTAYQEVQLAKHEFAMEKEKINGASYALRLMEKERALFEKQLKDRSVYAKFDGVVAALNLDKGQYAKAQDNFGTLIDRSYFKATVEVSESDAFRLAVGKKALLNFSAVPGVSVEGEVTAYPSIARLNAQRGNTVLDVKIVVKNPPGGILPGYSFSGTIIAGEDEEILVAEQSAVRYEEGKPFVDKIDENGKTESVQVEISPYTRGFIKFLSGVKEGDSLVNHGSSGMKDFDW